MNQLLADLKRLTGIPARCGREGPVAGAVRKGRGRHGEARMTDSTTSASRPARASLTFRRDRAG